ncbi:protein kinase domain-containing protein [Archangium primigenium]|uniref:protein kinase domain-containing protein n=1 Tax=[Archangium] primigenium TaxID=2792470 RepID=UPI00195DB29A|nr:protein kinase [Archangium primigenium]
MAQGPTLSFKPVAGERLGGTDGQRFEILSELGEGGMGQVLRAYDAELQRVVALKFFHSRSGAQEAGALERLRQEARAIAQLDHENVLRIFDVAEWRGAPWAPRVPFLIMECLEGESLAALLRREGRLGLRQALEVMGGVAAGLAHVHGRHLVHRDLKPSNVFLGPRGRVTLIDFGLAWSQATEVSSALPPIAGTPAYMSPEQWRGAAQDARSDLWSAGLLLYEMLTGAPPYPLDRVDGLRACITSPEPVPSVRRHCPELPEEVEALVAALLMKAPAQRLASAARLVERLRQLEEALGPWREAPREVVAQRRSVTVMACHLGGARGAGGPLDPEELGEWEARFHQHCSEIVQAHGGSITACMGDEVLACFGYPVAHEEDAEHAVAAGLRLVAGPFTLQVGLHTETVVLDDRPAELRGGAPTIQGEAPRVAAWLARGARPGSVVLSAATQELSQGAFESEGLEPGAFEGLSGVRPLGRWRVARARATVFRFDRTRATGALTPLVGREAELRRLLGAWERAREGQGAFVLVSGEAGLGKSRLLQEARQRVSRTPSIVLRCQCWSQFSQSAYHPVVELLQRLFRLSPEGSPEHHRHVVDARLLELGLDAAQCELLAAFLSLPSEEATPRFALAPHQRKERTREVLLTLLLRLARERPVLAVVEDLHWADPSTRELLAAVRERVGQARVLLLASTREPEREAVGTDSPAFHHLALERLSAPLTARMVREAAGIPLSEETVHLLVDRTDGVPLFVEEMASRLAAGAAVPALPLTLQGLLLARMDALPGPLKSLIQLCAVVGRDFTWDLMTSLTRRAPATLRQNLEALVASGLLRHGEEALASDAYQFRHALFQEAAYQSLPRGPRRHHHRRIAQALEEQLPEVARNQPELLAHHYTEAGVPTRALEFWRRAGLRAVLRSANAEAASHLRQALTLLGTQPDTPARAAQELQLLTALGIPLSQVRGLADPEVKRTYARVRELFPRVGDALPALELSYWGPFAYSYSRGEYREAYVLGEQLVDVGSRQAHQELLALGYRMMATILFTWGRMREALAYAERAVTCSDFSLEEHRRLAVRHWVDPTAVALAHAAVMQTAVGQEAQARARVEDALRLAERIGHPQTRAYVRIYGAVSRQMGGDARGTLELAEACLAIASERRERLLVEWVTWAGLMRAWALAELGWPEEGLEGMRAGLGRWRIAGLHAGLPYHVGLLARVHVLRGRPAEALRAVGEALARAEATGERFYTAELHRFEAQAWRALGDEARARGALERAVWLAREQGAALFERRATGLLALHDEAPGNRDVLTGPGVPEGQEEAGHARG